MLFGHLYCRICLDAISSDNFIGERDGGCDQNVGDTCVMSLMTRQCGIRVCNSLPLFSDLFTNK